MSDISNCPLWRAYQAAGELFRKDPTEVTAGSVIDAYRKWVPAYMNGVDSTTLAGMIARLEDRLAGEIRARAA